MKKQVRRGVFETNSSSVHSLTMCSQDEYSKWEKGEILFHKWNDEFKTRQEIIEELKTKTMWSSNELRYPDVDWENEEEVDGIISDEGYYTEKQFFGDYDFETFHDSYTTGSGETIIAFGYYGYDG